MNESEVSVSSAEAPGQRRLPLIRVNRRFVICCALCAAICQLLLIESRLSERSQVPAMAIAVRTNPVVEKRLVEKPLAEEPLPLQIQPPIPPATPFVNTLTWRQADDEYLKNRVTRWDKFETEFGITEPEQSPVLRSMQTAKYNLDRFVFAANEFSHNLSSLTEYELDHGRLYRVSTATPQSREESPIPWTTIPENVRLGLDINVAQGRPYVGVKLVVPFGN